MVRTGSENGTLDERRSNFSLKIYGARCVLCVLKSFTRAFRIHDQEQINWISFFTILFLMTIRPIFDF